MGEMESMHLGIVRGHADNLDQLELVRTGGRERIIRKVKTHGGIKPNRHGQRVRKQAHWIDASRSLSNLEGGRAGSGHVVSEQTNRQAAAEHLAMNSARDWHGQAAQPTERVEEINGGACASR
jgi:hypothetical protein